MFTLLKLNKAGDNLFDSPLLTMWQKYIAFFREKNPSQRVNELSILRKHFNDANLSKMLLDAEKVPSTKAYASDLLDDLLIRWMAGETDPARSTRGFGLRVLLNMTWPGVSMTRTSSSTSNTLH